SLLALVLFVAPTLAKEPDLQPLAAQAARIVETMDYLGSPLSPDDRKAIADAKDVAQIEAALDRYCLVVINVNPESRVKVARGAAEPYLVEQGWRTFLVRVNNEAGVTAPLRVQSPNAGQQTRQNATNVPDQWLDLSQHVNQPMQPKLSGLGV